jgi:hypothetical protein
MENLSTRERRILREIDRIRNIIYGHDSTDAEWIKNVRPYKLTIERDELIRNFVISRHLLVDGFLDVAIREYFVKVKHPTQSRRVKNFQVILRHLTFREKVEFAARTDLISGDDAKWLNKLNALRNHCAHQFFLPDDKGALRYEGSSVLTLSAFEKFAEKQYAVEELYCSRQSGRNGG